MSLYIKFAVIAFPALLSAQTFHTDGVLERLGRMKDLDRSRLASSILSKGYPSPVDAYTLHVLAAARSDDILPLVEAKIEEVLKAPDPSTCFEDKNTKPDAMLELLVATIWGTGDLQALREVSKLLALKIDAKGFHSPISTKIDGMVANVFDAAYGRNRFSLAYQALDMGDIAIDTRVIAWIDELLSRELPRIGNPIFENRGVSYVGEWAEALVDRYGGVPSATQLFEDPIASRLRPELNALQYQVRRFTQKIVEERTRKQVR